MSTFGITPVSGFPLPTSDDFPNFIQFQSAGVNLGAADADTVTFNGSVQATRGTGESSNVVTVTASLANVPISWRSSAGDTTLVLADAENGIAMTNGGLVIVPAHAQVAFPDGTSILLLDEGYMSPFSVVGVSGINVRVRSALLPHSAGLYAMATIIQRGIDNWVLCGDLENA